jgi:hypothetical protein
MMSLGLQMMKGWIPVITEVLTDCCVYFRWSNDNEARVLHNFNVLSHSNKSFEPSQQVVNENRDVTITRLNFKLNFLKARHSTSH